MRQTALGGGDKLFDVTADERGFRLRRFDALILEQLDGQTQLEGAALLGAVSAAPGESATEELDLDFKTRNGRTVPVRLFHKVYFGPDGKPGPSRTLVLNRARGESEAAQRAAEVRFMRFFQNTPKWTASVSATASADLFGGTFSFTPAVSMRSDAYMFEIATPALDPDGYFLVDASAGWTSGNDKFKLSLNLRNLTNERYRVGGYNFPGALFGNSIIGFYGPPRTATVSLEYRF